MSEQHVERPVSVKVAAPMLFVSGGCALIFQVVWIRELRLVFGATTAASAAVLAIFMGGLGLGNAYFGRRIDNSLRPFRAYGLLELGIAVSAAASVMLIDAVRQIYVDLGGQLTLGPATATVVRLLAAAIVLAVPTFLMGGTMPATARAVSIDSDRERRGVALLYGINTLGAVCGAGLANFVLLEVLGNRSALWTACAFNILLSLIVLGVAQRLSRFPAIPNRHSKRQAPNAESTEVGPWQIRLVYASSAIVGFIFFLMEIVWYRMLGPLLGGTTYTFGLILCIALMGIGLGGALYSLLARRIRPSLSLLSITCAVEAATIAVPFWWGDGIALWVLQQQGETIATFRAQVGNWFEVAAFVILLPALAAGFQFPLLVAIAGRGKHDVGRHVGLTFAANTLGAICGSLAGGFLLLPLFSAPGLWRVCVVGLVLLSIAALVFGQKYRRRIVAVASLLAAFSLFAIGQSGPTAVWRHAGIGAGRALIAGTDSNSVQDFINAKRRQCIWQAEGVESSVAITAVDSLAFIVNGKSDGNAYGDAGTQIGLGLIGPLLHQNPKSGLVIGLGTGESAGWLAAVADIRNLDVVELEPVLDYMVEQCEPLNQNVLKNPKVRIFYNDAREHLLTTSERYDVIVSEPSNPYRAGIANLYTTGFYQAAYDRLTKSGLFVQWLQGYEVDDRTVRIVLRTISRHFPTVQIWRTRARDMVIVCGKTENALAYDAGAINTRLGDAAISEGLKRAWRADDFDGILAHYVCGSETIARFLQDGEPMLNTDDRNLLEYAFARTVGRSTRFSLDDFQAFATSIGDDSPLPKIVVDRDSLARRRLALSLYLGGTIPDTKTGSSIQKRRSAAYRMYLASNYEESAGLFRDLEIDSACPIERLVYAHALAETGRLAGDELMDKIAADNATEATAIQAIASYRRNDANAAIEQIVATLKHLRENPWGSRQLLESVLGIAAGLADVNEFAARRIYAEIKQPFAMYRLEETRRMLRYLASEHLEPSETLQSLADLEPNVPWKEWFLKNRAQLYESNRHPLAGRARRELERFQEHTGMAP